ncbi:MFS transporter [Gryllotalpicola protaetiae]|uniref:MFS transporter n=1 Tax=Gryllotalpicola protaetiae TaxID=2419771 RepID=A0A387BRD9_9MICO|nr:MFS transporter [Gryllotalpicola protaetiae]AYG04654.1 MFS transporter [Gryllotalpicola protaetiae]
MSTHEPATAPQADQRAAQPDAVHDPHHGRRWLALGVILIAQMMLLLDATIVNVALPSVQADLGFSDAARGWVVTAYLLAFGSLLLLGGRLADAFGRKSVFITGLIGFAVASAVAGAAPNIAALITARAFQGGFAAIMAPAALSLITVIFTDLKELNKAFAIFGAVAGSSSAVGLMLGGLLTDYAGWRWTMYVNIVFAVVGVVGGFALLHNTDHADTPRLSVPSTILGSAALFGLVFGASTAQTNGWGSLVTLISLIAGAGLLVGFIVLQRFDRSPLVPLHVLADRNRGAAYLTLFLGQAGVFVLFLFLTYYFQGTLGYSPLMTGVAFLPMMITVIIIATLTQNVLVKHLTLRVIVAGGLLIGGAGAALLAQTGIHSPYAAWVLPGLVLAGVGIGSAIVSAVAVGQLGIDARDAGTAGAVNNVFQQLGPALGIAVVSTVVAAATGHYLTVHGHHAAVNATMHGYSIGFWWAAGAFWAGAVLSAALIRGGTRLHHEAGQPEPLDEIVGGII